MKPHIWQKEIIAWANGETIQYESSENGWLDDKSPCWDGGYRFRVKPEPKPDVVKYVMFNTETREPFLVSMVKADSFLFQSKVLMVRIDGETGELKSAEVLK